MNFSEPTEIAILEAHAGSNVEYAFTRADFPAVGALEKVGAYAESPTWRWDDGPNQLYAGASYPVIVDGDPVEWATIPSFASFPAGDMTPASADVTGLKLTHDEHYWYCLVTFAGTPTTTRCGVYFQDRPTGAEWHFETWSNLVVIVREGVTLLGDQFTFPTDGLVARGATTIEFRVPFHVFAPNNLSYLNITRVHARQRDFCPQGHEFAEFLFKPAPVNANPVIHVDGAVGDWANITPAWSTFNESAVMDGEDIKNLYWYENASHLCVRYEMYGPGFRYDLVTLVGTENFTISVEHQDAGSFVVCKTPLVFMDEFYTSEILGSTIETAHAGPNVEYRFVKSELDLEGVATRGVVGYSGDWGHADRNYTASLYAGPARTIVVDGMAADWEGVPDFVTDPAGDAPVPAVDFTSVQLAHDEIYLYGLLATLATPEPCTLYLALTDTTTAAEYIIQCYDNEGVQILRVGTPDQFVGPSMVSVVKSASHVEFRIPYSFLGGNISALQVNSVSLRVDDFAPHVGQLIELGTFHLAAPELMPVTPNPAPDGRVTLTWSPVPNATEYRVYQAAAAFSRPVQATHAATTPDTSVTTGILPEGTYYFAVEARHGVATSNLSACRAVVVQYPPPAPVLASIAPNLAGK